MRGLITAIQGDLALIQTQQGYMAKGLQQALTQQQTIMSNTGPATEPGE